MKLKDFNNIKRYLIGAYKFSSLRRKLNLEFPFEIMIDKSLIDNDFLKLVQEKRKSEIEEIKLIIQLTSNFISAILEDEPKSNYSYNDQIYFGRTKRLIFDKTQNIFPVTNDLIDKEIVIYKNIYGTDLVAYTESILYQIKFGFLKLSHLIFNAETKILFNKIESNIESIESIIFCDAILNQFLPPETQSTATIGTSSTEPNLIFRNKRSKSLFMELVLSIAESGEITAKDGSLVTQDLVFNELRKSFSIDWNIKNYRKLLSNHCNGKEIKNATPFLDLLRAKFQEYTKKIQNK